MILPSSFAGPTTETVGYFNTPAAVLADWLGTALGPQWTVGSARSGTLADFVGLIEPTAPQSRYLLLAAGDWTLLLDNGPTGTDLGVLPWHATRDLGCRTIRATAVARMPYPATILEVFAPEAGDERLYNLRTLVAANDGGRWTFTAAGDPLPFEDLSAYRRRLVRDRFTPDMLAGYLTALGAPADRLPDPVDAIMVELR